MRQNLLVQGAILLFASLCFNAADAQLPDGSIAPDFTLTDIEGNEHNLYSYLDQGKKVILQFDATWNLPGWNYLTTGALQEVWETYGPDGTEEVMVLFLESDPTTTISDLAGGSAATQGNWIAETPYPIIDNAVGVFTAYNTFVPAIYTVCPNRRLTRSGQLSAEEHAAFLFEEDCEPATEPVAPKLWANASGTAACAGYAQPFLVELINMGTQPLTVLNLTLSDGAVDHNVQWYGNLETYESTIVDLGSYGVEEGQNWSVYASISGVEDFLNLDLVIGVEEAISQFIRIDINTDNWGYETGWQVLDGAGDVVAEVEPFGVYESNSFYSELVEVPVNDCITFVLSDVYGDGMNASQYEGFTADGNCTVYTLDGPGPASDISSVLFSYDGSTEFSTLYFPFSTDDENFTPGFPGCMDDLACNYEPQATLDDGSCLPFDPLKDCSGNCLQDCNGDGVCDIIEGFESYDVGDSLSAVSPLWQLWDPDGSPDQESFVVDDALLPMLNYWSTFEGNVHSGAQSLMIEGWYNETVGDSTVEVHEDVYLPIGEDESGILTFFYNPVSGAYFNVQEEVEPGIEWAFEVFWIPEVDSEGTCTYRVDFETVLEFPFTLGEWVELEHHFDLEANVMNLYVDGCFKGQLPYDGATIGGLDFYSYYGNGLQGFANAFVDDLSFVPCGPPLASSPGGCTVETACNYDPAAEWDDGSCCYCNWLDLFGEWAWSDAPGALSIGPTPNSSDWYSGSLSTLAPAQQDDRWVFHPDGKFEFLTNGVVTNPFDAYSGLSVLYGPSTWDWEIDYDDMWAGSPVRFILGDYPIQGSSEIQCGWMGLMDTGSEYEVTITSDTTMVFVSPIRLEDCSAASEGFITMTFQKVAGAEVNGCTPGCMDPLAFNYDSNAQIDVSAWGGAGSCVYGNCDDVGNAIWDDSELGIFGFQDDTAYVGSPTVFEGIINVPQQINQDGDTLPVVAFTDIEMVSLVPGLELDSVLEDVAGGSQICVTISGTPELEGNWLAQFNGQMIVEVFGFEVSLGTFSVQGWLEVLATPMATDQEGCTYPGASNFDAEATIEDGSCLFAGCTNIVALNYSPWANDDDGSCILDSGADACPDLDGNGNVTVSDLVIFLGYFGSACP